MSFFEPTQASKPPVASSLLPKCGACGLHLTCKSPKIRLNGQGQKGILLIGEAPTQNDDDAGDLFTGSTGGLLRQSLGACGVDLDVDCWRTSAIICHPLDGADPADKEIDYCRPNLLKVLRELKPRVVVPLGRAAIRSAMAYYWGDDVDDFNRWIGWQIPCQKDNTWIVPNWNPKTVVSMEDSRRGDGKVVKLWFERHIEAACSLLGRPWGTVPDYQAEIKVVIDPQAAAAWIREKTATGKAMAFDYETTCLKPHWPGAEIICASICWAGQETIAYPWTGEAIAATKEFLASSCPKIGANNKFEEGWSQIHLGVRVNNWAWDTMLSAHHLDHRDLITSVKFQAFVRKGQGDWHRHIKPFLSDTGPDGLNKIKNAPLRPLLVYCGMDSLMEFLVAGHQKAEMQCK